MLIDTHVHLNNDALYEDVEKYLKAAREEGVQRFLVIGYDPVMNARAIELAENHDDVYASVGVHPTYAKHYSDEMFDKVKDQATHSKVKAIGECGMDYHWEKDNPDEQRVVFAKQIELAKQLDKPVVVHMRDATEDTYETLKAYAPIKGVMHCYSGSLEMAYKFLDLGLHVSLGGPVTFKNAKVPKEVAKIIPDDKLLVETDAPFLAPHPYRGKQNDSSYLPLIAEAVSELRGMNYKKLSELTTKNAKILFNME